MRKILNISGTEELNKIIIEFCNVEVIEFCNVEVGNPIYSNYTLIRMAEEIAKLRLQVKDLRDGNKR